MRLRNVCRALLVLLAGAGWAHGQISFDPVNHDVQVVMRDVDDLGFVLLLNREQAMLAAKCEWRPTATGGEPGQGTVNLRPYLVAGDNYFVVGCFNKQWPYPGGKYAYDFRVNIGMAGGALEGCWSAKAEVPDPDDRYARKLVFAKVFNAYVDDNGDVRLGQAIDPVVRGTVKSAILEFENTLLRNGDDVAKALPHWVVTAAVVVEQLALHRGRK